MGREDVISLYQESQVDIRVILDSAEGQPRNST